MEKKFTYKNATITYDLVGEGFPVLLLHGFGEDRTIWKDQVAFLKSFCRLIIPDLPGSGASPVSDDDGADTIEFYADCINPLLEQENISACIMLGHSMGGYITLSFAERYKDKLKGFGLVHSSAFADSGDKKQTRQRAIAIIGEYGAYSFLKTATPNLFGAAFKKNHPEKIDALVELGNNFSARALQQYYTAMMNRPDRALVLKNAALPVLFIIGTEDIAAPMNDVLKQVHLPEKSYVHILENTGHMGMLEETGKVNTAITEFIKDIKA